MAPPAAVLDELAGIEHGLRPRCTRTHRSRTSRTASAPRCPPRLRRRRSTSCRPRPGAAKAIGHVLPNLDGKLSGDSIRVPVPVGSIVELNTTVSRDVTREDVLAAYRTAAEGIPCGRPGAPRGRRSVSSDITGNPASSIFDSALTRVDGRHAKVVAWYDNEWGFSNRVIDTLELLAAG
ncbi:hypothetical protein ACRAWF_37725 [Streptomyces sp. L7]